MGPDCQIRIAPDERGSVLPMVPDRFQSPCTFPLEAGFVRPSQPAWMTTPYRDRLYWCCWVGGGADGSHRSRVLRRAPVSPALDGAVTVAQAATVIGVQIVARRAGAKGAPSCGEARNYLHPSDLAPMPRSTSLCAPVVTERDDPAGQLGEHHHG